MGNPLQKIGTWLVNAMTEKLMEPITKMQEQLDKLEETVNSKHADDPAFW